VARGYYGLPTFARRNSPENSMPEKNCPKPNTRMTFYPKNNSAGRIGLDQAKPNFIVSVAKIPKGGLSIEKFFQI